jgi:hypothetical protein
MLTTCQNLKNLTTVFNLTTINHIHNNNLENPNIEDITKINKFLNKFEKAHDEWFVDYQEQVKENLSDWYPAKNDKSSFIKSLSIDPEDYRVIVGGYIDLHEITNLNVFPTLIKKVKGDIYLKSLTYFAKGLKLPDEVDGYLGLNSITSANGLKFPEKVKSLQLDSLITTDGLVLPNNLEKLHLFHLRSAKGLVLPDKINFLDLPRLTSVDDLVLPDSLKYLELNSMFFSKNERENVRNKYPKIKIKFG